MKRLSEKLTGYIIRTGAIPEELYAVYQYGFQIGLEMLCCFAVCLCIAIYLHMVLEFMVFTGMFIFLRTYAGGIHLNSFAACFICSVGVQTLVLIIYSVHKLPLGGAWSVILAGGILILQAAPVENVNRELNKTEKVHCKKVTLKIVVCIVIFAGICTVISKMDMVSLVALNILVILISQYFGLIKYKIEKKR